MEFFVLLVFEELVVFNVFEFGFEEFEFFVEFLIVNFIFVNLVKDLVFIDFVRLLLLLVCVFFEVCLMVG